MTHQREMCANILTHLACSAPSLVGWQCVIDSRSYCPVCLENEGLACFWHKIIFAPTESHDDDQHRVLM